jgi:hypothetical protein
MMFSYFTCERYHCTMQRRHCIARMTKRNRENGRFNTYYEGCRGCEQGRQNAMDCGVLVHAVKKKSDIGYRRLIDELAVLP